MGSDIDDFMAELGPEMQRKFLRLEQKKQAQNANIETSNKSAEGASMRPSSASLPTVAADAYGGVARAEDEPSADYQGLLPAPLLSHSHLPSQHVHHDQTGISS